MKNYDIEVNINGSMTFNVVAEDRKQAQEMVDDLLENSTFREMLERGNFKVSCNKTKEKKKGYER